MSKYYVLDHQLATNPCRFMASTTINRQDVWWNDGAKFEVDLTLPIRAELKPYNSVHPESSQDLPSLYDDRILFFSDSLIAAIESAGVTNLDKYAAELYDPDNDQTYTNYKAVNIIGMIAAADMQKSAAIVHDGIPHTDVSFDSLVIDEAKAGDCLLFRLEENNNTIMVHERVKEAILAAGITDLTFHEPAHIAI